MRGHFSAAICLLTGACLLNRGWMLIVLMTSQSPRVQRARSLKQAERHSGSQRNPESLRNLSDTTLLHAKTWCIRTAEKGFLTCLCNSGSPGAQMKTVFQVLRVDCFCCVWLAIQCYTMQDSFCHAYDLMCRLILVIRSPKLHVCQKYGRSSSLKMQG